MAAYERRSVSENEVGQCFHRNPAFCLTWKGGQKEAGLLANCSRVSIEAKTCTKARKRAASDNGLSFREARATAFSAWAHATLRLQFLLSLSLSYRFSTKVKAFRAQHERSAPKFTVNIFVKYPKHGTWDSHVSRPKRSPRILSTKPCEFTADLPARDGTVCTAVVYLLYNSHNLPVVMSSDYQLFLS